MHDSYLATNVKLVLPTDNPPTFVGWRIREPEDLFYTLLIC